MASYRLQVLSRILVTINLFTALVHSLSTPRSEGRSVVVVGAGISGLTIAHVLQQSGKYDVEVLEAKSCLGGHIRSLQNPNNQDERLNIGHATHMGMFCNLRMMLRHFEVKEWTVGRGPNNTPGIFRMISVTGTTGETFQPPLDDIMSPVMWWEAFRFYFASYLNPNEKLGDFLAKNYFSERFLDILYWAMATFEFDKRREEADEYAVGAARALLITQVFFQYLLCDAFEGSLPSQVDRGLKDSLASRIRSVPTRTSAEKDALVERFVKLTSDAPLASYFTANYGTAVEKLAAGAGRIRTNTVVISVSKQNGKNRIETSSGGVVEADHVIFTTHPSIAASVLNPGDFPSHMAAVKSIGSGAVGVRIIHARDLSFSYPPALNLSYFDMRPPPSILGIFDISELTTTGSIGQQHVQLLPKRKEAGWLSVAYPVYMDDHLNRHAELLKDIPCADASVYPWTRATPIFSERRSDIVNLQGTDGIYMTGQVLTGVNKASELQVTNALNLCFDHFGVMPPWKSFFPCPMLPDCNDVDAFYQPKSMLEAVSLAMKNLVGSFLLASAVAQLGVEFFD